MTEHQFKALWWFGHAIFFMVAYLADMPAPVAGPLGAIAMILAWTNFQKADVSSGGNNA